MYLFVSVYSCLPWTPPRLGSVTYNQSILINGRYPHDTKATLHCARGVTQLGSRGLRCQTGLWVFRPIGSPACESKENWIFQNVVIFV